MSVILDALQKARREAQSEPRALHDTRALDPHAPSSAKRKDSSRRGLLVLLVLGSVSLTLVLCAIAFVLLAFRTGLLRPDWAAQLFAGTVVLPPAAIEVPVGPSAAPAPPAAPRPNSADRAVAVAAPVPSPFDSSTGPIPTPAPLSAAAALPAGQAGQTELPISVQHPALPPPVPAAQLQVSAPAAAPTVVVQPFIQSATGAATGVAVPPAAPAAAPAAPLPEITVGTILCDNTGCTAALNGRTVKVGDAVHSHTVMAITQDQVTLQRPGEAPVILRPRF